MVVPGLGRSRASASWTLWLPDVGIGLFIVLYFMAAAAYPGGTGFDHHVRGYSHLANYWCDLLDSVAYSGEPNDGRTFALLGTVLLPMSLMPLWWHVPVLFHQGRVARLLVSICGGASMLLATLVFTEQHDVVVNFSSLLGLSAVFVTTWNLWRSRRWALVMATLPPLLLGSINYLMWRNAWHVEYMAIVQKACYVALFAWVHCVMRAIRRALTPRPSGEARGQTFEPSAS